ENILLTRKGEVKVADFGLSRDLTGEQDLSLTQTGVTMGTPLYMSPEQAQGNPLDSRSDVYSFGVTCYHMFTGRPPFRGQTAIEVALKHVNEQPPSLAEVRPDLPPAIASLVNRMMSKDPAKRPQSGREILRELSQPGGAVTSENPFAGLAVPPSDATTVLPPVAEPRRRTWPWVIGIAGLLLAGLAGAALRLGHGPEAPTPVMDDYPSLPVVSDRERRLLAAVELYTNPPPKTPDKIRQGAGHCVELGVLYWEQRRLSDAQQFFEELGKNGNAPPTYKTVAKLGLAVSYSLEDEFDRSNKLFLEVRGTGGKPIVPPASMPVEDAVNLRHWVATALERNATRQPIGKEIEEMRRELRWRPNMGGGGKAQ
ncbi:MAG TPA: serine/threonine-protein kinase, partial [Gemmataceae bacterium]|nr:serine/threonine-protein kinase [Gemmataceae bacterium]